jgi:hypothetical protein
VRKLLTISQSPGSILQVQIHEISNRSAPTWNVHTELQQVKVAY